MLPNDRNATHLPPPQPAEPPSEEPIVIPPRIVEAQLAFRRDLPQLLHERPGQWVAYHGGQRIGFGRSGRELYEECHRRGLDENEYVVVCIEPEADVIELPPSAGG
jgi:hypothetical protein